MEVSTIICPSYVTLKGGEYIMHFLHPSKTNYLSKIVLGIVLVLLCCAVPFLGLDKIFNMAVIPLLIAALLLFANVLIKVLTVSYVITNARIITKRGLIAIRVSEIRIADIRAVNYSRTLSQALFGVGNIIIGTAATDGAEIVILGVRGARKLVQTINKARN